MYSFIWECVSKRINVVTRLRDTVLEGFYRGSVYEVFKAAIPVSHGEDSGVSRRMGQALSPISLSCYHVVAHTVAYEFFLFKGGHSPMPPF